MSLLREENSIADQIIENYVNLGYSACSLAHVAVLRSGYIPFNWNKHLTRSPDKGAQRRVPGITLNSY